MGAHQEGNVRRRHLGATNWAEFARRREPASARGGRDPDALGNLASMGLVVAASPLADGRDGFVALAWFDDALVPKHAFAAEGLLDPRCSR